MNEELEERGTQEAVSETVLQKPAITAVSWLRFAYVLEFLIATIAAFTSWGQVGGQGHLDMLPWYVKLLCVLAMSWCIVRLTAGMALQDRAWNRKTRGWLTGIIAVGLVMAGITYYYHLHEVPDEPDTDDTSATSVSIAPPERSINRI